MALRSFGAACFSYGKSTRSNPSLGIVAPRAGLCAPGSGPRTTSFVRPQRAALQLLYTLRRFT